MEYKKTVKITNKLGFHMRAAAVFAIEAEKFKSVIKVRRGEIEADGKSIMGLMTLIAPQDSEVELKAEGNDAKEALEKLSKLIKNKFGEKE
ncbi:MAG TPA: HPr family phosphocarrier protein [Candidatus Goldiibacteriota bacterium]|nr:HPr family phosphocarrier protein [Candidatus Goldiibacteriota bacterium]